MKDHSNLISRLPECLHWHPDGEIRVVGRRISLFNILKSHDTLGESPETIAEDYELPLGLVRDVVAFARENQRLVETYMTEYQAELDRQYAESTPSPAQLSIRKLLDERKVQQAQRDS